MTRAALAPPVSAVAVRVGLGVAGGWVFVFGFVACATALLSAAGMVHDDARTLACLLAFVLWLVVLLWSFAARSAWRVGAVLFGGGLAMTLVAAGVARLGG